MSKSQDDLRTELVAQLTTYVTSATVITTAAITEQDDEGDASKQLADGETVKPVLTVIDGNSQIVPITVDGDYIIADFDLLLYLVGIRSTANLTEAQVRALISGMETQVRTFMRAKGGNTSVWNSVQYNGGASNDLTKTLAQILFGAKIIPLRVISYQ